MIWTFSVLKQHLCLIEKQQHTAASKVFLVTGKFYETKSVCGGTPLGFISQRQTMKGSTVSSLACPVSTSLESQVSFRISSNIPHWACILAKSRTEGLHEAKNQRGDFYIHLMYQIHFFLFSAKKEKQTTQIFLKTGHCGLKYALVGPDNIFKKLSSLCFSVVLVTRTGTHP